MFTDVGNLKLEKYTSVNVTANRLNNCLEMII